MNAHRSIATWLLFCTVIAGFSFTAAAIPVSAENDCFKVVGKFESWVVPPDGQCQSSIICTRGKLIGSLHGDYEFAGSQMFPTGESSIPYVMFYVGLSRIHTQRGDIRLTDAGALDVSARTMSALLTVTGGTGYYSNARGYLHVFGSTDNASGFTTGSYEGMICR